MSDLIPHTEIKKQTLSRFYVLAIACLLFIGILLIRLFYIQVIQGSKYSELANKQYNDRMVIKANRGVIYDRNMIPVVTNQLQYSYGVDPFLTSSEDAVEISKQFSKVFGKSYSSYLGKIRTKTNFVWLERAVSEEKKQQLKLSKFKSVVELKEPTRLNRFNDRAGQLLGFTNIDNKGISGIELKYDSYIRGKDGYQHLQRDGVGRIYADPNRAGKMPESGHHVVLTLDIKIQGIVDEELQRGVQEAGGKGGVAIFMIPSTGEIVAMSHAPGFNPNQPGPDAIENSRIRSITDVFEPGSTFKLVTVAAAFEQGIRTSNEKINAENGQWPYKDRKVIDHEKLGTITFAESVIHSSNVVMAKTGLMMGDKVFYSMARNFGFGMETGIDLPGEIRGELKQPVNWSGITLAWMSFGYEMLVTPLQLLNSYAAFANNGKLMRPYVVKEIIDEKGKKVYGNEVMEIRQVMKPSTVDSLKKLFVQVVEVGTGKSAKISGVSIAGKTGTAQKIIAGQYQKQYMASFVGFFPAENPQLVGVVIIDSPLKGYYGGAVSAPIFGRVAQRVLGATNMVNDGLFYSHFLPDSIKNSRVIPDVRNYSVTSAITLLNELGFETNLIGDGDFVESIHPSVGSLINTNEIIGIKTRQAKKSDTELIVKELRGKSLRMALNQLQSHGYSVSIVGSGEVSKVDVNEAQKRATIFGNNKSSGITN